MAGAGTSVGEDSGESAIGAMAVVGKRWKWDEGRRRKWYNGLVVVVVSLVISDDSVITRDQMKRRGNGADGA